MVKYLVNILILLTLIISKTAFALNSVTASIDTNPVMSNESIILTVVADDSVERDALDTSALLKDFVVARTEVSSQTSMINFKTSRTTRWQIVLIPRKTGDLIIPALTIEGHQSQAINVQVIEQGSTGSSQQQDIFISAELSSNDVYVQQLVTLTIKLHVGVQLQRGSLTEPSLQGALIEQVGKDQENEGIVNGKRYRIIERTYAITPEKSGDLTLVTPMFSGDIMVQSKRRSGFLSFGETKPVNVLGDELTLKVRPIPNSYPLDLNNNWLPSELLTLHQEWQPEPKEFKVGEPITRTITLTAAGLGKSQLPKITMNAPAGLKIYPDQAELHSNLTKERLISQKRQNFALVASQTGEYTLPKITISWWNTVTNKYQQAILPEQTIIIKANPDAPSISTGTPLSAPLEITQQNELTPVSQPTIIKKDNYLQWVYLSLWLLTVLLWALHVIYLKRSSASIQKPKALKVVNNHYLSLMAACKLNNAEQALSLILPWLNSSFLNQNNNETSVLSEAVSLIESDKLTKAIDDVQQYLYGNKTVENSWIGNDLLNAIQEVNTSGIKVKSNPNFTLNPS
jgi:hypothetical protein